MFEREILELKGLARSDADAGEFGPDILVLWRRWHELEGGVEILVEVLLYARSRGRDEIDLRRSRRRGLLEERGKRLHLVSRLHLLHVRHVRGIEELGTKKGERERCRRGKHFLDSRRRFAFPVGTNDEIVAGVVPRRTTADVAIVVGIAVDQLHRVVALFFHGRHRNHHRLRAQIQPDHRVRCVAVWRDDRRVLRGGDAMLVVDLVEGCLELAGLRVHRELIHHRIIHHEWQTVDEAFLGDGFGFCDPRSGDARLLVGLLGRGNGVAFLLATGQGDGDERRGDNSLCFHCRFLGCGLQNLANERAFGCSHSSFHR